MEFRVLGPLEVVRDGGVLIDLGAHQQRAVLALLLLAANEVVARDRLIDGLWGERPPPRAANTIQVYVSQLRKRLGTGALVSRPRGYLLRVGEGELDLQRFEALVVRARDALEAGDAGRARELLGEALALWHGPPLADFTHENFAQAAVRRLEERRLDARVLRIDADLSLGRHSKLVGELKELIESHSLHERLREQLMLALYRSGREPEALDAYRAAHRTLDEAGSRPSQRLQKLQLAILTHDPTLDLGPVERPVSVVGIRPVGRLELWQDRDELRYELIALLRKGQRIISVVGRQGVGKSAVVTKVLAPCEEPQAADAADSAGIDGVVYLSTRTGSVEMTLTNIFDRIVSLLPRDEQVRLSNRWANAGEAMFGELFDLLRPRRIVVVLDNLDDVQDQETGEFLEPDVPRFLDIVSRAPRPPQVVTTSRRELVLEAEVRKSVTQRELNDGLEPEFGASLLRALDADGSAGLRDLDHESLRALSDRVGGIPRGLELIFRHVLERRAFGVDQLLNSTSAPDTILAQLVSTAYERLLTGAGAALDVMDVIAVARAPLPPRAFRALCNDRPADQVEKAVDDLLSQSALVMGRDRLVQLHPLDTDHVYKALPGARLVELHLRLAGWYAAQSSDRRTWRRLADADPVKWEYHHRWRAGHHAEALDVLAGAAEFLGRRGDFLQLRRAVAVAEEAGLERSPSREVCLGYAEFWSGFLDKAVACFREASRLAGGEPRWDLWTGIALRHSGRALEATQVLLPVASDERNSRAVRTFAAVELGLSCCFAGRYDDAAAAIRQLEALEPDDAALSRTYLANIKALLYLITDRLPESVSVAEEGIAAYQDSPSSDSAEYVRNTRGLAWLRMGRVTDACDDLSAAATNAEDLGHDRTEGIARTNLAWASLRLRDWNAAAAEARKAANLLKSSSPDYASAPLAIVKALDASADQIDKLLRQAANIAQTNPDFHSPEPGEITKLVSAVTHR